METEIPQKKRTKFTPSVVLNILLIVGVLAVIGVVFYAPKATFFKGALLLRPSAQIEKPVESKSPGALLIDYVTKNSETELSGKLITLTSFVLEAQNEEMEINSFLFEFEGAKEEYSIKDVKLLIDGHEIESSNYIWISHSRLLVEVSPEEVKIKERLPVMLQGVLENVESGQKITILLSDVSATGLSLNKPITNIGVKGATDAAGTALNIK